MEFLGGGKGFKVGYSDNLCDGTIDGEAFWRECWAILWYCF